jgi:hypothetical protein
MGQLSLVDKAVSGDKELVCPMNLDGFLYT